MVFDTLKHAQEYRNRLVAERINCPSIIAVEDNCTIDATGFVLVGQQHKKKSSTLGQLPIQEHHSFITYQEALKLAKHLSSTLQELEGVNQHIRPQVSATRDSISALEQEIAELNEELTGIQQDIDQAEEDLQHNHNKKQKTSHQQSLVTSSSSSASNSGSSGAKSKKRKKFLSQES
jgi:chromosome segregation ATPase